MNNKTYDVLKFIAIIVLPALATLWSVLGLVWGFPYTEAVVATIVALNTFLGALLGVSTVKYNQTYKK